MLAVARLANMALSLEYFRRDAIVSTEIAPTLDEYCQVRALVIDSLLM